MQTALAPILCASDGAAWTRRSTIVGLENMVFVTCECTLEGDSILLRDYPRAAMERTSLCIPEVPGQKSPQDADSMLPVSPRAQYV